MRDTRLSGRPFSCYGGEMNEREAVRPGVSGRTGAPAPECANEVVQHEKLLVENNAFALAAELSEQVAKTTSASDIEPEGLSEVLLRVFGRVRADEVRGCNRDPAALEIHPGVIHPAVRFVHLAEGAAELTGAGPVPVMIQKAVAQLMSEEADQHGP